MAELTILRKEISKLSSGSNPAWESSDDFSFFWPKPVGLTGSEEGFSVTSLNPLLLSCTNPLKFFLAWWNSILRWNSAESDSGSGPPERSEMISAAVSAIDKSDSLRRKPLSQTSQTHIYSNKYVFAQGFAARFHAAGGESACEWEEWRKASLMSAASV